MYTRVHAGLLVAALLVWATVSHAQLDEVGSLRGFLLGEEPAASYDNWISHTVEGLAVEGGYNHYIPSELDPQTRGFGRFQFITSAEAPAARQVWRQVFRLIWSDHPVEAQTLLDQYDIPYEVMYFSDTETGRTYRMLRELLNTDYVDTGFYAGLDDDVIGSFNLGWGIFIINPESSMPWVQAQVVHVNDDFIAVPLTTDLFLRGDFGALAFAGAGREVLWPDGQDYSNSNSLSDPSRNGNLPLQWFTEFFVDTTRAQGMRDLTMQIHSYDSQSHQGEPTIQVSCGTNDSYANRPSRDVSWQGYDWVNFAPTVVVPQDYSMPGQAEVSVGNYFAVFRGWGLIHLESGTEISTNVQLSGYPDSPQMNAASTGYNRYQVFDRWLHVEFDELPYAIENAEYSELDFFAGTSPPTEVNWQPMLRYYESAENALLAYLQDVNAPQDHDPPSDPTGFSVFYAAENFVELQWNLPCYDPNFDTYQLFYGTEEEIDTTSSMWTSANDGDLVGQNIRFTRVLNLSPDQDYGFRLRGVDLFGHASGLTPEVRIVTHEGDQPPLPFSLLSPADGDTCFNLDTTFVWQATSDPDPFDVPHYDVWLDTLPDLSTAWMPQNADSLADTTYAMNNLVNRRTYYWSVRATDRNSPGTWANEIHSLVTYHPLPPAHFALLEPPNRRTFVNATSAILLWNHSVSQDDPEADITYTVYWANNPGFTAGLDSVVTSDTTIFLDSLVNPEAYWWKVVAEDYIGKTQCDEVFKFFLWDRQPPTFSLETPLDGERVDSDTVMVTWSVPEFHGFNRGVRENPHDQVPPRSLQQLSRQIAGAAKGSVPGGGEGWAAIDNQGGPDLFGHVWIDNEEAGGPIYDWIEINTTGTRSTVSDQDDATEVVMLPFAFPYFGNPHPSFVISSNGNIHFGNPDSDWHHYTIPSPDGPAGIVAPWWLDLCPNLQGEVYYQGDAEKFIVEWDNCREYTHANWLYTFQVILYPTGRIKFQYKSMLGGLADATIGIENLTEDDGLLVAFNAPYVDDGIAVLFTFEDWLYQAEWSVNSDFSDSLLVYTFDNQYPVGDVILGRLWRNSGLDALPDNLMVYWRVQTMDLYSQQVWADPGEEGRPFMVYIQEPPSTFELSFPEDDATVMMDTVTVSWIAATDPDPEDTLSYFVEWSDTADEFLASNQAVVSDTFFTITDLQQLLSRTDSPPRELTRIEKPFAKILSGRSVATGSPRASDPEHNPGGDEPPVVDELPDDSYLYWRVRARDQAMNETWPAHGQTPWRFFVSVPDPPGDFALLYPQDGDTLNGFELGSLQFLWAESTDPDPGDEVTYLIHFHVVIGDMIDTSFFYEGLTESDAIISLADTLGFENWDQWWGVTWQVHAISGEDDTPSLQAFTFAVEPFLSVAESQFGGIPAEFSLARVYPNPFNPLATVVIGLPVTADVRITIYNVLGQQVEAINQRQVRPGYHSFVIDAGHLSSGVYFVRAVVPKRLDEVRKIVLVR